MRSVQNGIGDLSSLVGDEINFNLGAQLFNNAAEYVAFKNYSERELLFNLLWDQETGEKISKKDFLKSAEKVSSLYNKNYLLTEANTAQQSAIMAKKWAGFEENADIYPNLEYKAIQDDDTRDEHEAWHGVILPINDKWWGSHYPPNGFNCRCDAVQTDKPVNKPTNNGKPNQGWDFNPGIEKRLFSEKSGYYKVNTSTKTKAEERHANNFYRQMAEKAINEVKPTLLKLPDGREVQLSKSAINRVAGKRTDLHGFNSIALYDMQRLLNDGKLIEVIEGDRRDKKTHDKFSGWRYYEIMMPNGQKGYVNIGVLKDPAKNPAKKRKTPELSFHTITPKLLEEK